MFFIARRYLFSPKSHSVVNIISIVSLFSLLLPVAAVVVLLSVFNGFGAMIGSMDRAMESDLTLTLVEGKLFDEREIDKARLTQISGVEALSYSTEQLMLLEYKGQTKLLTLRGVEADYTNVLSVADHIAVGQFATEVDSLDCIVVGGTVTTNFGIRALNGVNFTLYSLKTGRLHSMLPTGSFSSCDAKLSGVLLLDQASEERYGYVSRRLINGMLGDEYALSRVMFRLSDGADMERVRREILGVVGEGYELRSRQEMNPALYEIIKVEKLGVLLICSLVMVLASFSLVGALAMLIIEKRGDIMTLRSIGATRRDIRNIFLTEGLLISGVAIAFGVILGVGVTLAQHYFGFVELPVSSMLTQSYPVELQWSDVVNVVAIALLISAVLSQIVVRRMMQPKK